MKRIISELTPMFVYAGGLILIVALLSGLVILLMTFFPIEDNKYNSDIGQPLSITRELRCAEDEDIIVTLGENGLAYAFCLQAIER